MGFDESQIERYARHIILQEVGGRGQAKLLDSNVLVVGAGGLGSPLLLYLAAAGVGTLGIVDDDRVSLSNLQRQVIHTSDGLGDLKVKSAERAIHAINPDVTVVTHNERLTAENAMDLISAYDLVADGSDNFETRFLINDACYLAKRTLVSAAILRFDGQLSTFSFHHTKNVACGEGGALCVNDESMLERARILRDKGTNRAAFLSGQVDKYSWVDEGSSYLPSELACAFLLAQLEAVEQINGARKQAYEFYHQQLEQLEELGHIVRPHVPAECQTNHHLYHLLVADRGFAGLAVQLGTGFESVDVSGTTVTAGGATSLPVLARRTVAGGLAGFEWAVGVPGSIGGAVRMNAGGHGSDMSSVLVTATTLDLATGVVRVRPADGLALGYRSSDIGASEVVTSAKLRLTVGERVVGEERLAGIVRWRRENQPGGQNSGSVFTNPAGDSAGRLIDSAGLRGRRLGSAVVSERHANFIQADEGGSADDVRSLMDEVVRRVAEVHGVRLVPETVMVGFEE